MKLLIAAIEIHEAFKFFTSFSSIGYATLKYIRTKSAIFISAEFRGLGRSSAII